MALYGTDSASTKLRGLARNSPTKEFLFDAQARDCTSNHQLLNLRSTLKDGVNLCITVASPYRLGFHDFYCVKVTQTVSEPFVSSHKSADFSAGINPLTH
jgi:hypothetical protein